MQMRHAAVLDALIRIQRFLDANEEALGAVNSSGARRALDDIAERLADDAVTLETDTTRATGETQRLKALRDDLRRSMLMPIVNMVRTNLSGVEGLANLRAPRANLLGVRLIAQAEALADAVAPHEAALIAAGLKPNFLELLRDGIAELREALNVRRDYQRGRSGAAIRLRAEASAARQAIRLLDAAILQSIPHDDQLLAEWRGIKRIAGKPGSARTTQSGATTPVADGLIGF